MELNNTNLFQKQKILKKKIYINLSLILFLIIIITYFVIIPTIAKIDKISSDLNAKIIDLEEKSNMGQNMDQLKKSLKEVENNKNFLNNAFLYNNQEIEFITRLEELASQNNISQKINLGSAEGNIRDIKKIPIQLNLTSSFPSFINYFRQLESQNFYINIYDLDFQKGVYNAGDQAYNTINVLLKGYIFLK